MKTKRLTDQENWQISHLKNRKRVLEHAKTWLSDEVPTDDRPYMILVLGSILDGVSTPANPLHENEILAVARVGLKEAIWKPDPDTINRVFRLCQNMVGMAFEETTVRLELLENGRFKEASKYWVTVDDLKKEPTQKRGQT